ncbi:MAG: hypothetical protein QE277_04555 [Flectobacillus sp.]|nr:hypothetical protein [Flectobacillus sp.]
METTIQIVQSSLLSFFAQISAFLPKLLGALLILIIGTIIARGLRWTVTKALGLIAFDTIIEKVNIDKYLAKAGVSKKPSELVAGLIYLVIMLAIYVAFFNSLGLEVISDLLNKVIVFLPNVLVASLIMVVGFYLADFVKDIVVAAVKVTAVEKPELFGNIASAAVFFIAGTIALTQLNVGTEIITSIVSAVFGALALALGISFGLGGKDWAASIIAKYLK